MLYMIYYVHVLEIYKNHVNYASNFEIFVNVIKVLILCTWMSHAFDFQLEIHMMTAFLDSEMDFGIWEENKCKHY